MAMTGTKTHTTRATKALATPAVINRWIKSLGSPKTHLTSGKRGIHLLTCVDKGAKLMDGTIATKETWEYDVFGLLADYVADEWQIDRKSSVHKGTAYYKPMKKVGGKWTLVTPDMIGLNPEVFQRLFTMHQKGQSGAKMADFLDNYSGRLTMGTSS